LTIKIRVGLMWEVAVPLTEGRYGADPFVDRAGDDEREPRAADDPSPAQED
jgi:hypothetical protein